MGLEKAKSLLEVKDGKTFLDLIAEQVKHTRKQYGSKVRILVQQSIGHPLLFSLASGPWLAASLS